MAGTKKTLSLKARLTALTSEQLTRVYNAVSERSVARFSDHTTAVRRTQNVLETRGLDFRFQEDELIVRAGAGRVLGDDRVISVLVDRNPKTKGTKSHRRFSLYQSGMTIGQYVAAVRALGGKETRRKAIRDIAHDIDHGYIRISD